MIQGAHAQAAGQMPVLVPPADIQHRAAHVPPGDGLLCQQGNKKQSRPHQKLQEGSIPAEGERSHPVLPGEVQRDLPGADRAEDDNIVLKIIPHSGVLPQ